MFNNYPFKIELDIHNEEQLLQRISSLKNLMESGISYKKFELMVTNFNNGDPGKRPNELKTLAEWKTTYANVNKGDDISEAEIKTFFKYLQDFHVTMIKGNGKDSFQSQIRANIKMEEGFQMEYIIYKSLEI